MLIVSSQQYSRRSFIQIDLSKMLKTLCVYGRFINNFKLLRSSHDIQAILLAILFHSCGSISLLMPDMIDAGIEIFNPVQTNAAGMDPAFLKKEFGDQCTFWGGGIETAGTLNGTSTEKIREQVLERMEVFSKGGGFVFNTVHNILPDVPPENIIAMFGAVEEYNNNLTKIV